MAVEYLEYSPVARAARERAQSQAKSGGPDATKGVAGTSAERVEAR
jgi:hypothetical protein